MTDVQCDDYGSFVTMQPLTAKARAWLRWHCREAFWFDGAVAIEHRYLGEIVDGMRAEGLAVHG